MVPHAVPDDAECVCQMRGMTAAVRTSSTGDGRPMTAVKGAGYSSGTGTPGLESSKPVLETNKPETYVPRARVSGGSRLR